MGGKQWAQPRRRVGMGVWVWTWLSGLAWMAACSASWAQRAPFDVAPPPAWVQRQVPVASAALAAEQVEGGVHYLLVDSQVRVDGAERVSYRHIASKALNEQGVESSANIEMRFDPSYQRLTIHSIQVRRGAQVLPRLNPAAVRVLQRETELDALVYDGRKTASVFLEDVRIGDVVEYAFSVRGHNPVFAGRLFGDFDLQWGVPVAHAHARLLWPQGRPMQLLRRNGAAEPVVTDTGSHRDHRWERRNVPGRTVERDAPPEYEPFAAVQWGEFADWPAVVRWALPLYSLPHKPAPSVAAVAARIARDNATPEQRLIAALRHVQSEVRYLGVEIGAGSHAPSKPERVLERRFGDCKDKTLLTIALLSALGVEAAPALVNTNARAGIANWLPSPGAFNHVLVRAQLAGQDYWLDPTRRPQAGGLDALVQADFGRALVVHPSSKDLQPMAGDKAMLNRREIRSEFDARAGAGQPVGYTVTTVAFGAAAENLRNTLASQRRDKLQQDYTNFYAQRFDGLTQTAGLDVTDDLVANRISVTEHYRIDKFWSRSDKKKRNEAYVLTPELSEHFRQPPTPIRQSPLGLAHPVDLLLTTTVRLPDGWNIASDKVHVEDPAFDARREVGMSGHDLVLTDHFTSKAREVAAADVPAYASKLEKARQAFSFMLYDADVGSASMSVPHWLPAAFAVLSVLACAALAWRLYRWDPPARLARQGSAGYGQPSGLGGWLLLPGLGLLLGVYRLVSMLVQSWPAYTDAYWTAVALPAAQGGDVWLVPVLLFALGANIGMLCLTALLVVLFVRRRTSVPPLYVVLAAAAFATTFLDAWLTGKSNTLADAGSAGDWAAVIKQLLLSALWSAYFLRSVRVGNTFVQQLPPTSAARANQRPAAPDAQAVPVPGSTGAPAAT